MVMLLTIATCVTLGNQPHQLVPTYLGELLDDILVVLDVAHDEQDAQVVSLSELANASMDILLCIRSRPRTH
jgi:hypothetical protein